MKSLRTITLVLVAAFASTASADTAFEAAFRTSLLRSFDDATGKIVSLAAAIPEESYGWRPMEGVSTVRDILVHVTETNYALAERLGTKPPAGVERKKVGETMRTKTEAVATARQAIAFMRGVLAVIPAESLLPEVNVFGAKAPVLRVALLPVDHAHEHLGQLIAYARMNRVVPPWSK
jgi:uncharacterized damage-inducible protein DinB